MITGKDLAHKKKQMRNMGVKRWGTEQNGHVMREAKAELKGLQS
jgi:hypothetical protein